MNFTLTAQQQMLSEGLKVLLTSAGHCLSENGISIFPMPHEENVLTVDFDGTSLTVGYCQTAHFFRGIGLFLSHSSHTPFSIREEVLLDENGLMIDCSRNAVYHLSFLKDYLKTMALSGMNTLYLYLEDTYEIPGYPYFGHMRGRYTQEDLKELDAFASQFGIEVVPCIQTLAHMRTFLRWPAENALRDTDNIFLAEDENTYRLIHAMLASLRSCLSTHRIHLGMDEAEGLGMGRYLLKHGYENPILILQRHLQHVMEVCREFDFTPMIWSDMYFKLAAKSEGYYDLPEDYQWKEEEKAPDDLTLVYWDYYSHDPAVYQKMIHLHQSLASSLIFAGGGWTWNGLAPNYSKALDTTAKAMQVLHAKGLRRAFCTLWSDNGAETPMNVSLLPILFFAEYGFHAKVDDRLLNSRLLFHTGITLEDWMLLNRLDAVPGTASDNRNAANPSKTLYYQDPMLGLFDVQIQTLNLDSWYRNLAVTLEEKLPSLPDSWRPLFDYYRRLAALLSMKSTLGLRLLSAWKTKDRQALTELSRQTIPACVELSRSLLLLREQLWMESARPQGFEVLTIRMSGVTARLEAAARRLDAWLNGTIESLPELDEPRLPYDPQLPDGSVLTMHNLWEHLVSASNIWGV